MLVMTATEDCLQRGALMDIAKRFNVACSTIYRLWECMAHTCATGIKILPNLFCMGEILGECLSIGLSSFRRVSRTCH